MQLALLAVHLSKASKSTARVSLGDGAVESLIRPCQPSAGNPTDQSKEDFIRARIIDVAKEKAMSFLTENDVI